MLYICPQVNRNIRNKEKMQQQNLCSPLMGTFIKNRGEGFDSEAFRVDLRPFKIRQKLLEL